MCCPHAAFTTDCKSLCAVGGTVCTNVISPCLLALQSWCSFPRRSSNSSLGLCLFCRAPGAVPSAVSSWGQHRNAEDSVLCGLNRSQWLCLGWAVAPPGGLEHATVAQHSFWRDFRSCRKDRPSMCLLEQNPGDRPQQTALGTGAPLGTVGVTGFKSHRGALWSKPAHGTVLALVICWFWLVHSLMAPGPTCLPTEIALVSACACRGKDLGVRQTYCHLSPPVRTGLSELPGMSL